MSITAITIENFKGIREPVRVELKPITLLFGPNSAGKSTIIQALHYAREIFERQNLNPDRTLLGGGAIDLGGFESLVHKHDTNLPIKIGFELDLRNEDIPIYYDGGVEYFGTDKLDNAGNAFLLQAVSRVNSAQIEVTIRWSEQFTKPYIALYTVCTNGKDLISVESSPDGLQVYITKINPFNPIFLSESDDPEEIKERVAKFIEACSDEEPDSELWEDPELGDSGSIFIYFFLYMNLDKGVPGLTKLIYLEEQRSALPNWGKNLSLNNTIWDDGIDIEDKHNFIRLFSALAVGPGELVRDGLRKLCYVGPLREVPNRAHKPATSPEESRWANGLAAYDTLFFSEDTFIDKVNGWLAREDCLNSGYNVEVKKYRELETDNPLTLSVLQGRFLDDEMNLRDSLLALPVKHRLLIRDEARNIELAPQDIGVGISQVIPVVVAALHHKTGLVVIEQPELHIHPAFQVALGDLFIEQVRQYPDLIFILETHSEHLMLRFLRRIRETGENEAPENRTLTPSELSIYFIEQGMSGISCLSIRVDEDGDFIDRWPKGFFNERVKELY